MYRRISAYLFPVAVVALIAALWWGSVELKTRESAEIRAENQYRNAFHNLSYHVNQVHDELGKALVVGPNSSDYHRQRLINVWRLTSQAQDEINQLPLSSLPVNKTEEFLSNMANFSYHSAVRNPQDKTLSQEDYGTLQTLYRHSGEVSTQLNKLQRDALNRNLSWLQADRLAQKSNSQTENSLMDGFKTVDKQVTAYPEINWGPSVSAIYQKRDSRVLGSPVSTTAVLRKAANFLGVDAGKLSVKENGKGTEYDAYSVRSKTKQTDSATLDYSKHGGKLLVYLRSRNPGAAKLDSRDARARAEQFLIHHGYSDMQPVSQDEYGNAAIFTFATVKDGVVIYPEQLAVKVAMDNGEIIGLQAVDYEFAKRDRTTIRQPSISVRQAKAKLNPSFKVLGSNKAVVKDELNREVPCYEFRGTLDGENYRVFINSDNGREVSVERIGTSGETA